MRSWQRRYPAQDCAGQLIARFQETVDSFQFEGFDKETTVNISTDAVVNSITR
jgi:hypothetical protein